MTQHESSVSMVRLDRTEHKIGRIKDAVSYCCAESREVACSKPLSTSTKFFINSISASVNIISEYVALN